MSDLERTTRREFARRIGILAVTAPLAGACAAPPAAAEAAPLSRPSAPPEPAAAEPEPIADALHAVIRERYGAHLSEAQLAEVRDDIESYLGGAEAMREVPLQNSDGLACGLGIYRGGA